MVYIMYIISAMVYYHDNMSYIGIVTNNLPNLCLRLNSFLRILFFGSCSTLSRRPYLSLYLIRGRKVLSGWWGLSIYSTFFECQKWGNMWVCNFLGYISICLQIYRCFTNLRSKAPSTSRI